MKAFIEDLYGVMTVSDLAAITGLGWDTVKNIVKARLERRDGHPRLKGLRYLSLDEIYVGRAKKFHTLVIDLESGRIVWVAPGKQKNYLHISPELLQNDTTTDQCFFRIMHCSRK